MKYLTKVPFIRIWANLFIFKGKETAKQSAETETKETAPEPTPINSKELEEARKILLGAGLKEEDLKGVTDEEIVELAKEYKKQMGNGPNKKSQKGASPTRSTA